MGVKRAKEGAVERGDEHGAEKKPRSEVWAALACSRMFRWVVIRSGLERGGRSGMILQMSVKSDPKYATRGHTQRKVVDKRG
jgi:hypothetical protein